jgi:predicted NAD/FAD-binding protein
MKIAVIGSGISGLGAAYLLSKDHEVSVFEKDERIGGHTATKEIIYKDERHFIDTGFIVFNDWTYPNFIKLIDELGVESKETEMSFSVKSELNGLEYAGGNLDTLFAQRKNLFSLKYLRMLKDIVRFNKDASKDLEQGRVEEAITLKQYLDKNGYSDLFITHYLIPMGSAIWSAPLAAMESFPLLFFIRFFKNHGLLNIKNRPQWRVVKGGSHSYLEPLCESFKDKIYTHSDIKSVQRLQDEVLITMANGSDHRFDQVVFACHSDQALALLKDPSADEKSILGAIPYQNNEVLMHTDDSLLPKNKKAWASWNYCLKSSNEASTKDQEAVLTYNMNILQGLQSDTTFCVSLNASEIIDPQKIIGKYNYSHPVFSLESVASANKWQDINGVNKTWFCGAYWANGFHEDGFSSAVRVAQNLGVKW